MQTIKEIIRESGLKATPQRLAIYQAMKDLGHASADAVEEAIKEKCPSLTVATIYNVLESFVNVGLLVRRYSSNNKMYFDVNTYEHAHLYDVNKHSYADYNDPELIRLIEEYMASKVIPGFNLRNIEIQLVGTSI
jgi:Fur family transcriptional regulator, peroxide stress response regulator